jgi:hypothetical protein
LGITWVPATLEPEVTEAAVQDFMTFVLMDRDIDCNASSDRDDVVKWLGLAAGLHEAAVNEAKPMLRREQVFVVGDLALLEEEGGLGSVFTTLVSARRVRDALRLRSGHQPATVGCPAGGLTRVAQGGRPTATHHHGFRHCTPQAAHGRCGARS